MNGVGTAILMRIRTAVGAEHARLKVGIMPSRDRLPADPLLSAIDTKSPAVNLGLTLALVTGSGIYH